LPGQPNPAATAAAHVAGLLGVWPQLSGPERQAVADRLAAMGVGGVGGAAEAAPATGPSMGLPREAMQSLQRALALGPRDLPDLERTLELAALLSDLVLKLDAMMTDIWRKVAPNSAIRKAATLRVTLSRYAAGDPQISKAQAEAELALLRQITAGVASAISRAAPQMARRHIERFGAVEIERAVRDEGGAGGFGMEGKCWKKYQQACATLDAEAAERDVLAMIAEHAEKLIRSPR
jgi:hypothetical protein